MEIESVLDRLDTREYFLPTVFASGPETVRATIVLTPEFAWLEEHASEALPAMVARLSRGDALRSETPIPYFMLFEKSADPRAREAIVHWMESRPDPEGEGLLSPWHPWSYAHSALRSLAADAGIPADPSEAFRRRHELRGLVERAG